ncbi:hypothetical protein Tco_0217380, partial [Tanacetum coccineum]
LQLLSDYYYWKEYADRDEIKDLLENKNTYEDKKDLDKLGKYAHELTNAALNFHLPLVLPWRFRQETALKNDDKDLDFFDFHNKNLVVFINCSVETLKVVFLSLDGCSIRVLKPNKFVLGGFNDYVRGVSGAVWESNRLKEQQDVCTAKDDTRDLRINIVYTREGLVLMNFDIEEDVTMKGGKTKNTIIQDNPSSAQQDAMIMSVIEEMSNQVSKCNEVNKENKTVNETLTVKLERYKEQIKIFEERQKFDLTDREKYIDSQMREVIVDRNAKVADFQNQIHKLKQQLSTTVKSHKTFSTMVDVLKKESC